MSKFCTKCGATLEDNAAFCTLCGEKFETAAEAAPAANNGEETILDKFKANANAEGIKKLTGNPNFAKYVGIGAAVLALIIVIAILSSILGSGYKKPVKNIFEGIKKEDGEILMKAYHETELKNQKDANEMTNKEQKEGYEEIAKAQYKYWEEEYGKKLKISYKIVDEEKMDKDDLKDLEKTLEELWDEKSLDVSKAYELDVEVKVKGKDDDDVLEGEFVVAKVEGDWCIVSSSVEDGWLIGLSSASSYLDSLEGLEDLY